MDLLWWVIYILGWPVAGVVVTQHLLRRDRAEGITVNDAYLGPMTVCGFLLGLFWPILAAIAIVLTIFAYIGREIEARTNG